MKHLKLFEGYMEPQYNQVDHHTDLPQAVSMSDRTIGQIIKILGATKFSYRSAENELKLSSNEFICGRTLGHPELKQSLILYVKAIHPGYNDIRYCQLKGIDLTSGWEKPVSDTINYINISEAVDDWFRVAILKDKRLQWYRCDQLEGLEKFLKDMDII